MSTTCEIAFENPEKVFYSGQLLRGNARLTLPYAKTVRGVYVQIFGRAYAYWTKHCSIDHNSNRSSSTIHHVSYSGRENYLNEVTYFAGGRGGEIQLSPGTHTYTFECVLPPELPTSVQHDIGHIVYGASLVLDIKFRLKEEFNEHFTVIKTVNLNADPSFRCPAVGKEDREFYALGCFACCPSEPLTIRAFAPVQAYTPGQTINVTIKVNNYSDEVVGQFSVELIKEITFYGHGIHNGKNERATKSVDIHITGKETRGCTVGQRDTINVDLHVPSISPTDFTTSNVIHVKYSIRITARLNSCWRKSPVINIPITIGTYPILDDNTGGVNSSDVVISTQPSAPQMPNENLSLITRNFPITPNTPTLPNALNGANIPSVPSVPSAPNAPIEPYPSDDPPTYEEAMASECQNSNNFKPKYPMFRRRTSYSIENTEVDAQTRRKLFSGEK